MKEQREMFQLYKKLIKPSEDSEKTRMKELVVCQEGLVSRIHSGKLLRLCFVLFSNRATLHDTYGRGTTSWNYFFSLKKKKFT